MTGLIEVLLNFTTELNFKKGLVLLGFLAAGIIGFTVYERFTASFTISRLQHASELLLSLEKQANVSPEAAAKLARMHRKLVDDLDRALAREPWSLSLGAADLQFNSGRAVKYFSALAAWLVLGLIALSGARTPKGRVDWQPFSGVLYLGIPLSVVAIFVPTFWGFWGNLVVYPILQLVPFAVAAAIYVKRQQAH